MEKICFTDSEPKSSSNKQNQVKKLTLKRATQTEKRVISVKGTPLYFIPLTMKLYNKMTYNKLKIGLMGT